MLNVYTEFQDIEKEILIVLFNFYVMNGLVHYFRYYPIRKNVLAK